MKPQTTRTLNPLPFQDLEPHRFEDLVRALAYDFRAWTSLEALGSSGDDGGMDIRGIERLQFIDESDQSLDRFDNFDSPVEGPSNRAQSSAERLWIFQCKREESFSPSDVRKAVKESLTGATAPHGFVLAVACDLSQSQRYFQTRDDCPWGARVPCLGARRTRRHAVSGKE